MKIIYKNCITKSDIENIYIFLKKYLNNIKFNDYL